MYSNRVEYVLKCTVCRPERFHLLKGRKRKCVLAFPPSRHHWAFSSFLKADLRLVIDTITGHLSQEAYLFLKTSKVIDTITGRLSQETYLFLKTSRREGGMQKGMQNLE